METVTMKKAKFIACPDYHAEIVHSPWGNGFFNNKSVDLNDQSSVSDFVKEFSVSKPVSSAVVRATAHGIFEIFINGTRIQDGTGFDELKPTCTDYEHHLFVYTYDITAAIKENNVFVGEVSQGWRSGRMFGEYHGDRATAFICEIEITYADGTADIIATDESWLSTVGGPVRAADIWDGWYYDSRIAPVAESRDGLKLIPSVIYDGNKAELIAPMCENIRIDEKITRVPLTATVHNGTKDNGTDYGEIVIVSEKTGAGCEKLTLKAGESVILDMGQNMVGRPCIEISAKAGTRVRTYFAEMLNDSGLESRGNDGAKGSMYIKNYRSALARIVYIANGAQTEKIDPLHVFYGFRYLEITADSDIEILSVKGLVMKTDMEETGTFTCSDEEVNQLFSNVVWGARGNYLSIPTDCPQRDERYGWTGDTQIFANAGSYLMNTKRFFEKWLNDARDSQIGYKGSYCCVIPRAWTGEGGNAAWADAGIIVPDVLYRMYNDTDILRDHYQSMCDYMAYIDKKNGLDGPNTAYGDWLNYEVTDKRYIAVCYYAYDAALMVKFSTILAECDAEKKDYYLEKKAYFEKLSAKIKAHFLKKYFRCGNLKKKMRTQTTYLLALRFNLIPDEYRADCIKCLEKKIIDNNYTLSTGFVGTGVLNETLQQVGLYDLSYDLLLQTADPSWLYSVRQGATTIWERWNSYTKATGFGDVGMNSFNHYAYGAVAQWMIDGICGILPDDDKPGFKHFLLCPTPDKRTFIPEGQKRMTNASATYKTEYGTICSSWKNVDGNIEYSFTIPEGTTARVGLLDCNNPDIIKCGSTSENVKTAVETVGDRVYFTLDGGEYTIK